MNKVAFTEDELRQAALQVHEAMMAALTPFEEHEFSFEFHRKMSVLRRKMKLRHGVKAVAKSVAAVFLALLIGGGALLTFNADVRAAFFSWVREIYENSAFYQFVGEEESDVLPYIRPKWLPKGYLETDSVGDEYCQIIVYQQGDNKEDFVIFTYSRANENTLLRINSRMEFKREETLVNEYEADMYTANDKMETNELVWFDDDRGILCEISSYEEKNVILHIADSIYWSE